MCVSGVHTWVDCELFTNRALPAIRLIHGSADRVTSHLATLQLYDRLPNDDKEIEIYEGYEHSKLRDNHGHC